MYMICRLHRLYRLYMLYSLYRLYRLYKFHRLNRLHRLYGLYGLYRLYLCTNWYKVWDVPERWGTDPLYRVCRVWILIEGTNLP